MAKAYVAMGSNLGDRAANLQAAERAMSSLPGTTLRRVSTYHVTPPQGGPPGQGAYLNAAAALDTSLTPLTLLAELLGIERQAGRDRSKDQVRWGPRPLDLDLLLYDDRVIDEPSLTLPHPRMHHRLFVLAPLAEIAPHVHHPTLNKTIAQLLKEMEPQMNTDEHG